MTVQDVLRVVKPVYDKTPETGRRLRARIERVLDYATAHGYIMARQISQRYYMTEVFQRMAILYLELGKYTVCRQAPSR